MNRYENLIAEMKALEKADKELAERAVLLAAPDMLKVLKGTFGDLQAIGALVGDHDLAGALALVCMAGNKIQAAIDKAEGEE